MNNDGSILHIALELESASLSDHVMQLADLQTIYPDISKRRLLRSTKFVIDQFSDQLRILTLNLEQNWKLSGNKKLLIVIKLLPQQQNFITQVDIT